MKHTKLLLISLLLFLFSSFAQAQSKSIPKEVKSSAAYAEVLLRRVELESSLEEMLVSYTEEYPKIKETRYELSVLQKDLKKISSTKASDADKLTLALGKLLVRRAEIATDFWVLTNRYGDEHPQVKRARRKLEIFQKAIKEIF